MSRSRAFRSAYRSDLRGVQLSLSPESKPIPIETRWTVPTSGQVGANRRQKHSNSSLLEKKQRMRTPNNGRQGRKSSEPRAVKIGGLLIFIGRRDRRTASFIAKLRSASSGLLRSLSRCGVRLRGLRTQGLAGPRTHSRIPTIIAPGS